jgi:hypothetical protein
MSTVVGITDRAGFDHNTDNIVVVDPALMQLLWVPRDLWCPRFGDRVNVAYGRGGHAALAGALLEHGIEVEHSVIVSRAATERALADVSVIVPVPAQMTFLYPLTPTSRIEDGSKPVVFNPPAEILRGERIHQWLGARAGSDLHRIERQKIFMRRLLEQRFPFARLLEDPALVRASDPRAFDELSRVDRGWRFATIGPTEPVTIDGKQVLVLAASSEQTPPAERRR